MVLGLAALAVVAQLAAHDDVDECAHVRAPEHHTAGKDVVWEPTPPAAVARMLQLAHVKKGERVVDLGSGDGRIPIAAARDFGANGVGVEFNHDLVAYARCQAKAQHVDDRVTFVEGDLFAFDLTHADVVTTYLLPEMNLCLRPSLLALKPGTRIAAHRFAMADWQPDVHEVVDGSDVFFWVVPARVDGSWRFSDDRGNPINVELAQSFQHVSGVKDTKLDGASLSFTLVGGAVRVLVDGDRADGTITNKHGTFAIHGVRTASRPALGAWAQSAPLCDRYRRK